MLILRRMRFFNEFIRDTIDDRIIGPGEYYFEDPDDGTIISAEHYWELKNQKMNDEWDETYYNQMENQKDYKEALRQVEAKYKEQTVLNKVKLYDIR